MARSHSGRSHSLHLFYGSFVPPSALCLCKNPTGHLYCQPYFHLGKTSSLKKSHLCQYEEVCNKELGQSCRAGQYHFHQCPLGSRDCCSGMLYFWERTWFHLHLEKKRCSCVIPYSEFNILKQTTFTSLCKSEGQTALLFKHWSMSVNGQCSPMHMNCDFQD